jgi:hypothetical protein
MSNSDDDLLFKAGLAVGAYFFVVRPLLNQFGVSPEDTAAVADVDNAAPAGNPFSIQYTPMLTKYQNDFNTIGGAPAFFTALKYEYDNGSDSYNDTISDIAIEAENIKSALNTKWHNVNVDDVFAAFNRLQDKTDVALIAGYLSYNYDIDLWNYLRNGSWQLIPGLIRNGLNDTQLATITKRINSLPEISY